eukprot:2668085-Pleurochrysis_carterae.AAC.1
MPCVHCAARSRPACGATAGETATVVNLRVSAPSAHWAKVTSSARVRCSADCIAGNAQRGACDAKRGHQAAPPGSPQSA